MSPRTSNTTIDHSKFFKGRLSASLPLRHLRCQRSKTVKRPMGARVTTFCWHQWTQTRAGCTGDEVSLFALPFPTASGSLLTAL
ncbi:hypothetical protein K438DRAFT_533957 [Mycena galopus ATCC 62051]|nr:hypothetical protein K438DRAFT_533957 [Mycena galopus ATCC 62051]